MADITTALVSGFTTMATDALGAIGDIIPVVLPILAAVIVISIVIRIVKRITNR